MKKKLFLTAMLAAALMGPMVGTTHSAHAQGSPFVKIDSKAHLDAFGVPGTGALLIGEGLLVGVHYECPVSATNNLPQTGTMVVTATQAGSGDGGSVFSFGLESIICDGTQHEVVVAVPPSITGTTAPFTITGDFNDGPVALTASAYGSTPAVTTFPVPTGAVLIAGTSGTAIAEEH